MNFKVDGFGQFTAIKPFRLDTHDDSIKAYIKHLWDNDRINKGLWFGPNHYNPNVGGVP